MRPKPKPRSLRKNQDWKMNIEYWILNYSLEISGKNMNKIYAFRATRNNIGHVALVTLLLKQIESPVECVHEPNAIQLGFACILIKLE